MIREHPLDTNPYLKMRGDSQLRAKHGFERRAGWRYGLVFGLLLLFLAYGWDTFRLSGIQADFWWIKFALALVTILPLAIVTGGIGGYVTWYLKVPLWAIFGVAAAWCALHIPFEGARLALQNFDSNLRIVEFLPIPAAATDSFGMLATLGAILGILVALLQSVTVNWAWERSTDDYKMTLGGWAMFLFSLPLAIGYAILFDGTAHLPLRAPQQLVYNVVQSGLNDAPDQDQTHLMTQQWRKNFTPDFAMRLTFADPSAVGESFVDVTFANSFNLRCHITASGEFINACYDLNAEYARYLAEFVPRGSFRCEDCQAAVTQQAAQWRAQNARELTTSDKISVRHGAGSSIVVRVNSASANSFECLLWGANPVIVERCENF